MISDARVRTLARETGVTAGLAEKDYVNEIDTSIKTHLAQFSLNSLLDDSHG